MAGIKQNFKLVPYHIIAKELGITSKTAQNTCNVALKKMAIILDEKGLDFEELFYE